ncbi:hypothetical protein RV00_GL000835 [Enterococcus devriesei]|uniref:Uncharacterized protein n=1 Tax=Enterococcus devriesei TaxID=319970 RepID=A0A1L8SQR7_9ENTE|nr:hypothetical protein RV00_GL000835 [Enterococcus devriesei]
MLLVLEKKEKNIVINQSKIYTGEKIMIGVLERVLIISSTNL